MPREGTPDFAAGADAAHDALFRFAFARAECAAPELWSLLPAEVAAKLDFASFRLVGGPALASTREGPARALLFSVRLAAREAFVLLQLERGDGLADAPLRLLGGLQRLWRQYRRVHPARPLPLVIPVLVRCGDRRARRPASLCELFEVDLATWVALAPLIPDFTLVLDDLAGFGSAALRARPGLPPLARLALFLLQRAQRAPDLVRELDDWSAELVALLAEREGRALLAVLLEFVFWVADVPLDGLRALLRDRVSVEAEEIMITTAERLVARGRAEGELAGRARGELIGRAATLLTLLELRFGELSARDRERVRRASSRELERWTARLFGAASLLELFA